MNKFKKFNAFMRAWSMKHPLLFVLYCAIFFFFFFSVCKIHAEEKTAGEYVQDAAMDALGAATAFAASAEMAASGNFATGAGLAALGTLEAQKAWNEACKAWEAMHNGNSSGGNSNGGECNNEMSNTEGGQ